MTRPSRRDALVLIAGGASVLASACGPKQRRSQADAWTAIVVALGPWTEQDRELALAFAETFRKVAPEVPTDLLTKVADVLSGDATGARGVELSRLSSDSERNLVAVVVDSIYSSPQVFGYVYDELPRGQCLGDQTRHTRSPSELGW